VRRSISLPKIPPPDCARPQHLVCRSLEVHKGPPFSACKEG
jgi:hypothetical protein